MSPIEVAKKIEKAHIDALVQECGSVDEGRKVMLSTLWNFTERMTNVVANCRQLLLHPDEGNLAMGMASLRTAEEHLDKFEVMVKIATKLGGCYIDFVPTKPDPAWYDGRTPVDKEVE